MPYINYLPDEQLNLSREPDYAASTRFITYIYERLGQEALRDFAAHPRQGLAALDDILAVHETGMDADSFFADWVLANYLLDTRREGGRFGYRMLESAQPHLPRRVRQLPAGFHEATPPYSADYYELPPPVPGTADQLLMDFRLKAPEPQDAWLQLVQVLPDRVDLQRFRASEHRGQPVLATLTEQAERIFVAVSPFTPGARQRTQPVHYSLALREQPAPADALAQVTARLRVRSDPEIADNTLGKLRPCSFVKVLQRGPQWSQVLSDDGLSGWSHNDFLFHLNASGNGSSTGSCGALTRAAHDGNLAAVQRLLANGADVNSADAFGRRALHEAAFWGHDAILARLLRAGADVNARDATGRSAYDEAVRMENASSLLLLHRAGSGSDLADPASLPLMIIAAGQGNTELLEQLLAAGHDVNWQDGSGQTALVAAAQNGQTAALKLLLAAGADAQWLDENGRSPLMLAAAEGQVGTIARLHDVGGDLHRQDREGHTALTLAAVNGHPTIVTWFFLGNSDVDLGHSVGAQGRNALHLAAAAGHEAVVALLLLSDMDIHARDADGRSALQLAQAAGHDGVVAMLRMADEIEIVETTDWNFSQQYAATFHAAARNGDLAEVDSLIRDGMRVDTLRGDNRTALSRAAGAGQRDMVLRLLLAGASTYREGRDNFYPALYYALSAGHEDIALLLLYAGARPGGSGYMGTRGLLWAADFRSPDLVHLVLGVRGRRRVQVDFPRDSYFSTPLFYAVKAKNNHIADILLDAGANPDIRDRSGASPLYYAVNTRNVEIVKLLLAAGADPNVPLSRQRARTLAGLARSKGYPEILDLLLAAGAQA